MVGAQDLDNPLPAEMQWPQHEEFGDLRTELFKVRDAREVVIGVASRIAARDESERKVIEWVLHFPARGSMYVTMRSDASEEGYRLGDMRAGSQEFADMTGRMFERWIADDSGEAATGRIELVSNFVGPEEELPEEEELL